MSEQAYSGSNVLHAGANGKSRGKSRKLHDEDLTIDFSISQCVSLLVASECDGCISCNKENAR